MRDFDKATQNARVLRQLTERATDKLGEVATKDWSRRWQQLVPRAPPTGWRGGNYIRLLENWSCVWRAMVERIALNCTNL